MGKATGLVQAGGFQRGEPLFRHPDPACNLNNRLFASWPAFGMLLRMQGSKERGVEKRYGPDISALFVGAAG